MDSTNTSEFEFGNAEGFNSGTNQLESSESSKFIITEPELGNQSFLTQLEAFTPPITKVYERFDTVAEVVEFWILLDQEDREVKREIYGLEYDFMDRFGDMELITHVVPEGDFAESNITEDAKLIYIDE